MSRPLHRYISNPPSLGLVLASISGGGPTTGTQHGPSTILSSGLLDLLRPHFTDISISEIHSPITTSNTSAMVSTTAHHIFHHVHAHTLHNRLPLTLGGCHTSAIGTLTATTAALAQRPAVICLDAHLALNTPATSPSGNLNGMPLAYATGVARPKNNYDPEGPFGWITEQSMVDVNRLVYIGTRDVDPGEMAVVREYGIKVYGMEEVRAHGIEKIMDAVFSYIGLGTPVHLSVNVDALDPRWAPCTGNPVAGGLSLEEGMCVMRRVRESGNLIAMDLVEVDPTGAGEEEVEETVRSVKLLIENALVWTR